MASASRGQFSSKMGFIMAAAGSAVGLGNVWGFPTKAASNGGAAFLLIYLLMVFLLAYPMLVAELTIGRHGQSNPVSSLRALLPAKKKIAIFLGFIAMLVASLLLSFYSILAGWLVGFAGAPILDVLNYPQASAWLTDFSNSRNVLLTLLFSALTVWVVKKGVSDGIEKWSSRLMPMLFVLFAVMIVYIFTQEGAMAGLKAYLIPDLSHLSPALFVDAMGQAFFSLSLGVTTMMVYGSYLSKDINIPRTAKQVALIDTGVAFAAGLLILPAMYVAKHNGVEIFDEAGNLISSGGLVFQVLPSMFETMGNTGVVLGVTFFVLMVIAALTSSISLLEVPVSCIHDEFGIERGKATWIMGAVIMLLSVVIAFNFESLFGLVADFTTVYMQPILGALWAVFAGWVWHRNSLLKELAQGCPDIEQSLFWKIWPHYVRYVCPVAIVAVFVFSII